MTSDKTDYLIDFMDYLKRNRNHRFYARGYNMRISPDPVSENMVNVTVFSKRFDHDLPIADERRLHREFGVVVPDDAGEWDATVDRLIDRAISVFRKRFPKEYPPRKYVLSPCTLKQA